MTHNKHTRRPLDAPAAADEVAEAVRRLNHALQDAASDGDWPVSPSTAYGIAGALTLAARRLPHVLHEVGSLACEAEYLRIDNGTGPEAHLRRVTAALTDAHQHTNALAEALNTAWSLLSMVSSTAPVPVPDRGGREAA